MIITKTLRSADGEATKFTLQTSDDHEIETAYVDYKNKHIICYSTQVGCVGRCRFCYTGVEGRFIRNLTCDEILDQCSSIISEVRPSDDKPILFSAMGVGDPLCNYSNYVVSAKMLKRIFDGSKLALATRVPDHIHIQTLADYIGDLKIKLMISLHSADESIRSTLIPSSVPVEKAVEYGLYYEKKTGVPVEYNVTLIQGVNDSKEDAVKIANLLNSVYSRDNITPIVKINRFNRISNSTFEPSERVDEFIEVLKSTGVTTEYYETNGSDINGACGQMVSK